MKNEQTKKEMGTRVVPRSNNSVKNHRNLRNFKQNHWVKFENPKKQIILTRCEIHQLLINSVKTLNKNIFLDKRRIGSIIKDKRFFIANSLIKNNK